MSRSYGVQQQKTAREMQTQRRKMKKQGQSQARPKSRRGNQAADDVAADIAAFEKWGFAPSKASNEDDNGAAAAGAATAAPKPAFAMPGKVGAWQDNADHLLRDDANGYYTGPVSAAVSAVAIKRLRKARLDTAGVVGAALQVRHPQSTIHHNAIQYRLRHTYPYRPIDLAMRCDAMRWHAAALLTLSHLHSKRILWCGPSTAISWETHRRQRPGS